MKEQDSVQAHQKRSWGSYVLHGMFLSLVFLVPRGVDGQMRALASLESEFVPKTGIDTTTPETEGFEISFSTTRIRAGVPIRVGSGGSVFIPGLKYAVILADTAQDPGTGSPDSFHEIGLSLSFVQRLKASWGLLLNYTPTLATNFKDIDSDHLRFSGTAMATYQYSDTFGIGFGAVATYTFGSLLPLPALSVDWIPRQNLSVKIFVPESAKAVYRFNDRVEVGLVAVLQGNQYTVSNSDTPELDRVTYTVAHGGAIAGLRFARGFWISGYVGHTVFRKFELEDDKGMELAKTDVLNAPIFKLSLEYRPGAAPAKVTKQSRTTAKL